MVYRMGERPVPQPLDRWAPDHPVARSLASGSRWFAALVSYKATPHGRLQQLTGMPTRRLATIDQAGEISRAEVDGLARAWSVSTGDLIASLGGTVEIVE